MFNGNEVVMRNLTLFIILLVGFIDYFSIGLIYPVFAALLFDTSDPLLPEGVLPAYRGALLGLMVAVTHLTQFICAPFLGMISDRWGRRIALCLCMGVGCVGYCLATLGVYVHSLILLLCYRVALGVSNGALPVAQAALADLSEEGRKARYFALLNASTGLGLTIGPFMGGQMIDPSLLQGWGYMGPFGLSGLLCLLSVILLVGIFSEPRPPVGIVSQSLGERLRGLRRLFQRPQLRWLFIAGFLFSFGWGFFNEFVSVLLRENFTFSVREIGLYYAWGGAAYALNSCLSIPLLKRVSPDKLVISGPLVCSLCMLMYVVPPYTGYVWTALPVIMYCLALVFPTAAALVSNQVDADSQGQILGSYQAIQSCAMGCGPLLFGGCVGAFPSSVAWGAAIAMVFAAFAFSIGYRRLCLKTRLAT